MGSSPNNAASESRLVVDPIHGDIHLKNQEWDIVDTLAFQRLRGIKQLGMGHVTYPSATHTRFAHSLGTLSIMARILKEAGKSLKLSNEEQENLRMAALLHDIGHYPYSHLMEKVDKVTLIEDEVKKNNYDGKSEYQLCCEYPEHGPLGKEIVTKQQEIVRVIGSLDRASKIGDIFSKATTENTKLVHSSLDMDRLDYLLRDSRTAGVPYGEVDINYLLNSLRVSKTGMVGVTKKALAAAEQFLLARFFMHKVVYYHKTTYAIEEACRQLLRRIRDNRLFGIYSTKQEILNIAGDSRLAGFTDYYVDNLIHEASQKDGDEVIKALAHSIESRRAPKLLKEVQVVISEKDEKEKYNHGTVFRKDVIAKIENLANEFKIPLGQFLLCQTPALRLEPRGPWGPYVTTKKAKTKEEEEKTKEDEETELIKVFVDDSPEAEPKSMVDIDYSLLHFCSGYYWQAFRLYVVYDGDGCKDRVNNLRKEVSGWGSL
ncbi:MAG: HD domain-containing protein [Planctomycetes bacterium]|nr:HD domain-containing protein [Planctomycetota bacterium]